MAILAEGMFALEPFVSSPEQRHLISCRLPRNPPTAAAAAATHATCTCNTAIESFGSGDCPRPRPAHHGGRKSGVCARNSMDDSDISSSDEPSCFGDGT